MIEMLAICNPEKGPLRDYGSYFNIFSTYSEIAAKQIKANNVRVSA